MGRVPDEAASYRRRAANREGSKFSALGAEKPRMPTAAVGGRGGLLQGTQGTGNVIASE